jgi:hypothetical protein
MSDADFITSLLTEQSQVIQKLDELNGRIEEVLGRLAPQKADDANVRTESQTH